MIVMQNIHINVTPWVGAIIGSHFFLSSHFNTLAANCFCNFSDIIVTLLFFPSVLLPSRLYAAFELLAMADQTLKKSATKRTTQSQSAALTPPLDLNRGSPNNWYSHRPPAPVMCLSRFHPSRGALPGPSGSFVLDPTLGDGIVRLKCPPRQLSR